MKNEAYDLEELFDKANQNLDTNNFADARDLFRKLAMIQVPNRSILTNLSVAEEQEKLEFLRSLARHFPESAFVRICEAEMLVEINKPALAVKLCTDLLDSLSEKHEEKLRVRLLRFRAAVLSEHYETVLEDFAVIWEETDEIPSGTRLRSRLVKLLSGIRSADAIQVVDALSCLESLPMKVKQFLKAKSQELHLLAEALE